MKRIISCLLVLVMLCTAVVPCLAENVTATNGQTTAGQTSAEKPTMKQSDTGYAAYLAKHKDWKAASTAINIAANTGEVANMTAKVAAYQGQQDVLMLDSTAGTVSYSFDVPADALYTIGLNYCAIDKSMESIQLGMAFDGTYAFERQNALRFPRTFVDATDIRSDSNGNEFAPEQMEAFSFSTHFAIDSTGHQLYPYTIALSAGHHTLTLSLLAEAIGIKSIVLGVPENAASFADVNAAQKAEGKTAVSLESPIVIEGEKADSKSARTLVSMSDNTSVFVTPSSAEQSRVNFIGGENWQNPGEAINWKFKVDKAGFYKLGFKYRQNYNMNASSYRWIKIDGKTPFAEATSVNFPYSSNWKFMPLGDADGDYEIYLDAGEHTVTMEVTMGDLAKIVDELEHTITDIGNMYVKITMITGEEVDTNRTYNLFKQIPDFNETLMSYYDALKTAVEQLQALSGAKGSSNISVLQNMMRVLKSMVDYPFEAHTYIKDYYNNYCSVGSIYYSMASLPMDIDEIIITGADDSFDVHEGGIKNFFSSVGFSVRRFFHSFVGDYNMMTDNNNTKETLTLWTNTGRDQAHVLNSLIQDSFTAKTHIGVNVKLTNATMIQGIVSGNGPDMALGMGRSEPVNLAMRGSLYNLEEFDDFKSVLSRFSKQATVPYQFNGGTYGLPESEVFNMLFIRTDIFENMGLKIPTTWTEFLEVSNLLQRQNLQAWMPSVSDSAGMYPTLLAQNGLKMYKADGTATTMTEGASMDCFSTWTDFYTRYKLNVSIDFYNRFRVGTCPMGIAAYTNYTMLQVAAPEIAGRWKMVPMPGTVQKDGSVNFAETGSGTACFILNLSKHKDAAWEFLKWWTSNDTQYRYSNNVESILGSTGRVASANIDAIKRLSWTGDNLNQLLKQWGSLEEIEELPGSYFTNRSMDQVFYNVVNDNANIKDQMLKWGKLVDSEIARKRDRYVKDN